VKLEAIVRYLKPLSVIAVAGFLMGAKGCMSASKKEGSKTRVYYETQPTFKWPHQRGRIYTVQCLSLPRVAGEIAQNVIWLTNYTEGKYTVDRELQFNRPYQCVVRDQSNQTLIVFNEIFTVQYEKPEVITPAAPASSGSRPPTAGCATGWRWARARR
jgi:hypothetical protein